MSTEEEARNMVRQYVAHQFGTEARILTIEGPTELVPETPAMQDKGVVYAWAANVELPDKQITQVTVLELPKDWYAVDTGEKKQPTE